MHIGVWRSLVARLNGVQEAASSNLVTPTNAGFACRGTKKRESAARPLLFFVAHFRSPAIHLLVSRYLHISPSPIGDRYSVASLRSSPFESSHSDHCRAAHFGARKKEDVQARLPLARNLLLILNFSQVYLSDISYVYHAELKIIISVFSRRGYFVHERNYFG